MNQSSSSVHTRLRGIKTFPCWSCASLVQIHQSVKVHVKKTLDENKKKNKKKKRMLVSVSLYSLSTAGYSPSNDPRHVPLLRRTTRDSSVGERINVEPLLGTPSSVLSQSFNIDHSSLPLCTGAPVSRLSNRTGEKIRETKPPERCRFAPWWCAAVPAGSLSGVL